MSANAAEDSWPAEPLDAARSNEDRWRPLRQSWRGDSPDPCLQAGKARVRWTSSALVFDAILSGPAQRNEANRLNQLTWESGDVCEIFIHDTATQFYIELHITPENQRLQLRFPFGAIDAIRNRRGQLEDFVIADPHWVETSATCSADSFTARAIVSANVFSPAGVLSPASRLRAAVCRYDYRARPTSPILSSTATLPAPSFHSPAAWTPLILQPNRSISVL